MNEPLACFLPARHRRHRPQLDLSDGLPGTPHLERAERVEAVLKGLQAATHCRIVSVNRLAEAEARALHRGDYLDFLRDRCTSLTEEEEFIPSIFRPDLSSAPLPFRAGMYCDEIGTPLRRETWEAALNSAACAIEAADHLVATGQNAVALCRPPGHHAGVARYGGYCYLNNAYLAALRFKEAGKRCFVLDLDYHIGDGSLEFADKEAPYFSLHADPLRNYPYLSRTPEQPHATLVALADDTSADVYLHALDRMLNAIKATSAEIGILSLGFDTLRSDPYQDAAIGLEPHHFEAIGAKIAALRQPLLVVLEGGYDPKGMTEAMAAFTKGWLQVF